jgi:hypothetical protein
MQTDGRRGRRRVAVQHKRPINAEPPGLAVSLGNRIALPGDFRFCCGV